MLYQIAGEQAQRVERVLDVRQGQLCWVVGTIYMDMPLKPNILEDISKDVSQTAFVFGAMELTIWAALDIWSTPSTFLLLDRPQPNADNVRG